MIDHRYGETSSNRFCRVAVPNCAMMAATIKKASIFKKTTIDPVVVPSEAKGLSMGVKI